MGYLLTGNTLYHKAILLSSPWGCTRCRDYTKIDLHSAEHCSTKQYTVQLQRMVLYADCMQMLSADGAADEQGSAAEGGTPLSSQQGSGSAATALEAFLDSAAQPTSRTQIQHAQSYSRYAGSIYSHETHRGVSMP